MDSFLVLHQAIFGGIAAAGFGVLFNVGPRLLLWCGAAGAVTLAVRTFCQQLGWNLEGASFAAALTASAAVQLLPARKEFSSVPLHVVGCIPMVPGSFAARAILGLFAVSTGRAENTSDVLLTSIEYTLRLAFTIGAIGTGLAIPSLLMRGRTPR
jgi:uncharacterized membrane protein YjjB (DUF3815 family)